MSKPQRPDDFQKAEYALPGLMRCTPSQARRAAEAAWKSSSDVADYMDWHSWLVCMKPRVERLMNPKLRILKDGAS